MAYDDSRFSTDTTYRDGSEYGGSGAFGADLGADFGTAGRTSSLATARAFDDSSAKQGVQLPVVDRLAVHFLWEGVLLVGTLGMLYLLRGQDAAQLSGKGLESLLLTATVVGLVAVGIGLTVRAAVPNLSLGPVAYACAMYFTHNSDSGLAQTAAIALGIAVLIGLVLAVGVVGFQAPAWAVSLGVGFAVMVWVERQPDSKMVEGAYSPGSQAVYLFAGFAVVSVLAALIGMVQPVRQGLGSNRRSVDPAVRPSVSAAVTAAAVLVGSTVTAGIGGLLMALQIRTVSHGDEGLTLTALALGAVLLGGTSAFGRRGGAFGTVLAVLLMTTLSRYAQVHQWHLSDMAIGAAAIMAGLVVTRLVEAFGKIDEWDGGSAGAVAGTDRWDAKPDLDEAGWASDDDGAESWASELSAQSTDTGWDRDGY